MYHDGIFGSKYYIAFINTITTTKSCMKKLHHIIAASGKVKPAYGLLWSTAYTILEVLKFKQLKLRMTWYMDILLPYANTTSNCLESHEGSCVCRAS